MKTGKQKRVERTLAARQTGDFKTVIGIDPATLDGSVAVLNIGPKADTALVVPGAPFDPKTLTELLKRTDVPSLFDKLPPISPFKADYRAPAWTALDALQAQSRLGRKPGKSALQQITSNISINVDAASASMADLSKTMDRFRAQIDDYGRKSLMASLYGRRTPDLPDFITEARERFADASSEDLDLDYRLPEDEHPRIILNWIWGPLREFTGHARVDALFSSLNRVVMDLDVGEIKFVRLNAFTRGEYHEVTKPWHDIRFKVTMLAHPRTPSIGAYADWNLRPTFDGPSYRGREMLTLVQFASYEDQIAWVEMIDRLPHHARSLAYDRQY